MIGIWPCKGYLIHIPDEGEFTKQSAFIAIDTIEFMMRKRTTSSWFQENEQYIALTYHHPSFKPIASIPTLDSNFLSKYYIEEELPIEEAETRQDVEIDFSSLSGKVLGKAETMVLSDVKAELIILDFWYSSCYPCIKTIPVVNALYDQFKDKGVQVFGVNIIDDEVKSKSRMEKYIRNNPMAYETLMAEGDSYATWVPNGYPTLFILDKNFKLIYEHKGFTENMADEITAFIQSYLEK
jgi:thiol-disulfide isomerase/thioredoxin